MRLVDEAEFRGAKGEFIDQFNAIQYGRIKRRPFKGISEALAKTMQSFRPGMDRHRLIQMVRDLPQIVDTVAMIGMVVRDHDSIQ